MGKNTKMKRFVGIVLALLLTVFEGIATDGFRLDYGASITGNFATKGSFAPSYIMSNNHGVTTQANGINLRLNLFHYMDTTQRFSYGFGVDGVGGCTNKTAYLRYQLNPDGTGEWTTHDLRPVAAVRLQQLFAEIKWRGVYLTVGMKERGSYLLNDELSSGDVVESANARPLPQARIGFINYQNIPFTKGWVQIEGCYAIGKYMDSRWLRDFNSGDDSRYQSGVWYNYKRVSLRTKPGKPFSVTLSIQAAMQFGGSTYYYTKGKVTSEIKEKITARTILQTLIPISGGSSTIGNNVYYNGNHYGSIDIMLRYRFRNGDQLRGYLQNLFEDGSGMAKLNGFDGLWGLEYIKADQSKGWLTGAVVEYFDFRNQSGPIHWAPNDYTGTTSKDKLPKPATGKDNYYNNFQYQGAQYYGLSMGSPMFKSPIYNLNGSQRFTDNRFNGFHIGIKGRPIFNLGYRLLFSYRRSLGTYDIPAVKPRNTTSTMLELVYFHHSLPQLEAKVQAAFDTGTLLQPNFGMLFCIAYKGNFTFRKK